ncbi:MAG: DNA mismatch repair endonuclease MutL [Synergistaceae bacterium]|jgi:DNA mismatch repair protein MutL|nr:DNA mismatch repair endonuclease MutL [Synergistaceae bacterium]
MTVISKRAGQIRRLERSVASRIAAGEVIERPVSAAKELLENSIDAGASDIRISLEQGGKASLVVEDDGCGIPFEELPLALERYATSKISSLEDLERVRTLGYRGEALSSVAAVSRVELRSRAAGAGMGGVIRCEGGCVFPHTEIPASVGTRIQVDDLFYNLPARRKFMKSATAELKRIIQVVQDYALVHPNIRFRVSNDGKALLDIGAASSTDEALRDLWGDEHRSSKSTAKNGDSSVSLWWNNLPGSRRVNVTAFVNGRRVQDATIRAALNSTGASIYGEWIVMAELPPEEVDVNIHPAKAEVRFRKPGGVFELVRKAAQELLRSGGGFSQTVQPDAPQLIDPWENYVPRVDPIGNYAKNSLTAEPEPLRLENKNEASKETPLFPEESAAPSRRYLGQVQGGYLVFDDPRGLCLVDAHAAHERILYEQIEDSYSGKTAPSQQLVFEQEIPQAIAPGVEMNRETLREMGFAFKFPGDDGNDSNAAVMTSVPALRGLGRLSPVEMLRSALRGIDEEDDPSKRDREVWWRWARTACRDAIKLGGAVEPEEAMDLIERLERCRTPYSCPHGRPTTIFLAGDRLKSWFER